MRSAPPVPKVPGDSGSEPNPDPDPNPEPPIGSTGLATGRAGCAARGAGLGTGAGFGTAIVAAAGFLVAGFDGARRAGLRLAVAFFAVLRLAVAFLAVRLALMCFELRLEPVRLAVAFLAVLRLAVERLAVDFLLEDFFFAGIFPPYGWADEGWIRCCGINTRPFSLRVIASCPGKDKSGSAHFLEAEDRAGSRARVAGASEPVRLDLDELGRATRAPLAYQFGLVAAVTEPG